MFVRHRIRAAALMVEGDRILLVQHVHPETGEIWWVPPGGGLEAVDGSVFNCARRETFEETGLSVQLERIVYIREFLDQENQTHHLELFISSSGHSGELTIQNVQGTGPDEHYIKDVRWVGKKELANLIVYPGILKDDFWRDFEQGFPKMKYLGVSID